MIGIAHGFGRDFTAADFRDKLENGRKVAILILEFFDRHGITIRRGDQRRTAPQRSSSSPGRCRRPEEVTGPSLWSSVENREARPVGRLAFKAREVARRLAQWVRLPLSSANPFSRQLAHGHLSLLPDRV